LASKTCCDIGLLGRPASESGISCHGDGAHDGRPRRRGVVMLAVPGERGRSDELIKAYDMALRDGT